MKRLNHKPAREGTHGLGTEKNGSTELSWQTIAQPVPDR
ncbi:hypothetical protein DA2_3545 [Desulfovibrio sp. A2]|nr:hypothetical protein DA2_3545 [Desulfovibrio sp. A2]